MNKLIIAILFSLTTFSTFATDVIKANKEDNLKVLDLVVGVTSTYSQASELGAKVVELLGGDGMNPTRMVLILSTGNPMEENNVFELGEMMYEVNRITFSNTDELTINFTQDTFDQNDNTIQVKRSIKVEVLRNASGELKGEIKVTSLK